MSKNIRDKGYEFLHTVTRVSISYGPASGIAASGLVKMLYLEKLLQAHVFMIGSCSPGPRAENSGRAPLHSIWCCATTYKVTFINPVRSIRRSSALQRSDSTLKQTQAAAGFAESILHLRSCPIALSRCTSPEIGSQAAVQAAVHSPLGTYTTDWSPFDRTDTNSKCAFGEPTSPDLHLSM